MNVILRNDFLKQLLLYEFTFISSLLLVLAQFKFNFLLVALSIGFMTLATSYLRIYSRLYYPVICNFIIALLLAAYVNTQAALVLVILFATTFLYSCRPLYLRQFPLIATWQLSINCSAIFLLAAYLAHHFVGFLPVLVFLIFFFIVALVRNVLGSKINWLKFCVYLPLLLICTWLYFFLWFIATL